MNTLLEFFSFIRLTFTPEKRDPKLEALEEKFYYSYYDIAALHACTKDYQKTTEYLKYGQQNYLEVDDIINVFGLKPLE